MRKIIDNETRKKLLTGSEESLNESMTGSGVVLKRPPKFISQVPHLTLKPGAETILDVEVESSSPVK